MKTIITSILCLLILSCSSCYNYRISTKALPASEPIRKHANVYLWGLIQKPKYISTPSCDQLGVLGVSEIYYRTNFGFALITVASLGIWCPVTIEYRCSKPCQPSGNGQL